MKCHRQCVCLLLQIISFVASCLAENLILNINFKKPIAVTDHAFLSFTLDPTTLQHNDFIKNIERSTNLARGLAPAYIRFGGPQSNFYNFEQVYSHEIDTDPNDMYFGTQWTLIYQWAKNAGLDIIVCITPHYIDDKSKTDSKDPRNIVELLSFSDRMGYNISWQLGYECQTRCNLSGKELGQYVVNLREVLKTFPRYSNSLIIGPDIVVYKTAQQQKYLQDYLHSANTAISAITWHPDLNNVSLNNDNISIYYNNMIAENHEMYKIISRMTEEKPLWIAESKSEESKGRYLGALIWMRRLGDAAKHGIQVVMRQLSDLSQATPVYWVSLLYKTLVGREVLEMNLQSGNESHIYFYSQCTKSSALYSKGAITIFGINLTPRKVIVSLKDLKIKILHKYILSPDFEIIDNKMFSEKVLLNNKSLHLINNKELPDINPEIIVNPDGLDLELPSDGIGFWVIPNAKVKACICSEEEIIENNIIKKLSKRHESDIRQNNQEDKEEDINQLNVKKDDVQKKISKLNLKNHKIYEKQDRKKQIVENTKIQQKILRSILLAKIKNVLQKQLQKMNKNEFSNLQRSFIIDLGEEQENSFEEVKKQQNLDKKDFEKSEVDMFESIRDILKKYEHILLGKKAEMETKGIQDFDLEIQNINNVVALISKINDILLHKVTSNESIISENKTKSEKESIIKVNKKLDEYLIELENFTQLETKSNIIKKIEKYFNKLYNFLQNSGKNNKDSQIFTYLMTGKRFKRHLDKKLENSKKIKILRKRSQIDNLKDHMVKQKTKRKNDDKKKLILSDNLKIDFINNEKKYNNPLQRNPKRFFKSDTFEDAAHHIDYHNLVQEHKRIGNDNIYRKHSKIGDIEKYQSLASLVQESERTKRDINKKLVEIGLKRDNAFRKRYVNERKTKQKDDSKREGLLIPFKPRIIDSDENFYGFFRQDPVKGFPEGDVFVTTGEQNGKDYDYVQDENDDNDSEKKNTQHNQKSVEHIGDNTWVGEVENDHCDYMPNEFFENIKLSNIKITENSKNYDDLWEAEFPFEEHNNNKNNNNEITAAQVIQEQPSMNYKASNVELREAKLKMEPETRISNSFYQPSQTSTGRYNYDNYQTSNMNHDKVKLKDEKDFVMDTDSRNYINVKTTQYSRPTSTYVEHPVHQNIFHNERSKRSNWEKLRKVFDEEMIKEDEGNTRDCHCRVIRASDLPKKLYYHRVKRNTSVPIAQFTDTSSENNNASTDIAQSEKNVQTSMTKEEYEEIMAGEILPSIIEPVSKENDTTMESVIIESSTLDHKLSDTTQAIDITSISEVDNISEQYYNVKNSTTNPVDSALEFPLNNSVTKETFFRTQPSDDQSKNKTKTYDSSQVISKIPSENEDNGKELVISVTENVYETTYEKTRDLINKEEKADNSIYPTTTEDQKNEERHNNDYKIGLKSINFFEETSIGIVEQVTTETILSKAISNTVIDNSKSNESKTNSKLFQSIEDNQNNESSQIGKDTNTRKLKTNLKNFTRTSLERLARYEGHLIKRGGQIDKRKEKLHARREKLLHQYPNELTKVTEQKRNLKRRETWEKLRESDDFHLLINQRPFIGILLNNDITNDDDENYLIPIELSVPKQYNNIDQIYLLAKAKKVCPEQKKYYQFLRNLIKDDEELIETSKSSESKYNQYYEYIPKLIKDKQKAEASRFLNHEDNQDYQCSSKTIKDKPESIETISRSFDRKVFIIDPSTYYGGNPILQSYEDYLKLPKYHSKIKSQIQNPTSRWILKSFRQVLSKLKSTEDQASKSQEYIKQLPIKDYYNQENVNILYVLDTQRQYDIRKELTQDLLNSFDRGNINRSMSNKERDEQNTMHKNLKDKDNLDSTFAINKKTEDFRTERNMENKKFATSNNKKKDIVNTKTTENAEEIVKTKNSEEIVKTENSEEIVKTKKSENLELIKHEEINKFYNSNDKTENNLNIKISNNSKVDEHVEKIIDDLKTRELEKKNTRTRRDVKKSTGECTMRLPHFGLIEDMKNRYNELDRVHTLQKEEFMKEIFNNQPNAIIILSKRNAPLSASLYKRSKNRLIPLERDFKMNQEKKKEQIESNYITLIPIEINNIYEMLEELRDAKNNDDDSLKYFDIPARWTDQSILRKIPESMNKYLDDKSKEFEYENLSNLRSKNNENILDEGSSCENEQNISMENSEVESEKNEKYRTISDEIDKYLKIKNLIESKREMFLLLPWRNMKKRQRRQIKNKINEDIDEIKHKVTRHSRSNKSILTEDKRTKRYLNNDIDQEREENIIKRNNIEENYLQSQPSKKNRDDLLEDFIKAHNKNKFYNNKTFSLIKEDKDKIIPLNNILKNKKLLQETIPKLQNYIESVEKFDDNSKENFYSTLTPEDHRNKISGTTGNPFYTAIMNIKDFFTFISNILHKF